MNPILILIVILVIAGTGKTGSSSGTARRMSNGSVSKGSAASFKIPAAPSYFDTFKMEMLLDQMHNMTNALEKVNRLNQMRSTPMTKSNSLDRVQDSLDAIRGFLSDNKTSRKLDNISGTISGVKKIGDLDNIMSTMGPILSMLTKGNED